MSQVFYDFSGGMESSAMLVVDRQRICDTAAIVRFADTGRQFPELYQSIRQIESILGFKIVTVPRRITFDEFLFERGGMVKKGTNDCSRRMKRSNLARHMKTFDPPYEVNLGFNCDEDDRADDFSARNERTWLHWRFPLIEAGIDRAHTWQICRDAGFTILVEMYEKMGRMDCFFCGNQRPEQALKVIKYYPKLAAEWMELEAKKGHSFMPKPLVVLAQQPKQAEMFMETGCACYGGTESIADEIELEGGESDGGKKS